MRSAPYAPSFLRGPRKFTTATQALEYVRQIYEANTAWLRDAFERFAGGHLSTHDKITACYPYVAITTQRPTRVDTRLSYGFVPKPGRYSTTLTRPDIFGRYYTEQFELLLRNHAEPIEVGVSDCPIPIHFAFHDGMHVEGEIDPAQIDLLRQTFTLPDLAMMDDSIANGRWPSEGSQQDFPLALFTAPRVDYSLHRLRHYTGHDPAHFQRFVIFTNYGFYMDEFVRHGREAMRITDDPSLMAYRRQYTRFVDTRGSVTESVMSERSNVPFPAGSRNLTPQMPACHLIRPDGNGITMINIGVGPSNARTISDHIAVLRPSAWIMLGHCAGLRETQRLGDYVLAHGYVRDDHVLDEDLPLWIPIPALAEVQRALESAVSQVTGCVGYDLKSVMRTGTVVSTDNRNWEITGHRKLAERFGQSRAIALDMESATIAANGFRFRVPYGVLLCVSDRPMHGEIKLPGMASRFYRQKIDQHLQIGIRAMELLRETGLDTLHSRKLRSFAETAFQ